MARKVFFSFHFAEDYWRTQQVRNINSLEGNPLCSANAWEEVKKKGDQAIKDWIDGEMKNRTCVVVLVGAQTSTRRWITYEIEKGWNDGRGVLGIRIDKLLDSSSQASFPGNNPFDNLTLSKGTKLLSSVAPLKTPAGGDSKSAYASIASNIETWIEAAIKARQDFKG